MSTKVRILMYLHHMNVMFTVMRIYFHPSYPINTTENNKNKNVDT